MYVCGFREKSVFWRFFLIFYRFVFTPKGHLTMLKCVCHSTVACEMCFVTIWIGWLCVARSLWFPISLLLLRLFFFGLGICVTHSLCPCTIRRWLLCDCVGQRCNCRAYTKYENYLSISRFRRFRRTDILNMRFVILKITIIWLSEHYSRTIVACIRSTVEMIALRWPHEHSRLSAHSP